MKTGDAEKFTELFEKISRLKAVKCRLRHEQVLLDGKTNLPLAEFMPELGYRRIGLCPPHIRHESISCGHTMARYLLEEALAFLESNGVETETLTTGLKEATNAIHTLDHRKGFAETHLAELIEQKYADPQKDLTAQIKAAKREIEEIGDLHDESVEKIGSVRDSIISEMRLLSEARK